MALAVGLSIQTVLQIEKSMFHKVLLAPLLVIQCATAIAATVWRVRHELNRISRRRAPEHLLT